MEGVEYLFEMKKKLISDEISIIISNLRKHSIKNSYNMSHILKLDT